MLSAWAIGHCSVWEQTAINSCMQPADSALGRTYCMPQCQLLKKIAEEKCFQMCVNYPVFEVSYVHGKQEVTTRCILALAFTLVSPVIQRCLRNRAINKSQTTVNIQEHHLDLEYALSRAY